MYPAPFDYVATESLDEALAVAERGDEAKVLAGGQSLIPLLKLRFASPEVLVDINRIAGLDTLAEDGGASDRRARAAQDVRALAAPARPLSGHRPAAAQISIRSSATSARSAARSRTRTRRATGAPRCWRPVRRSSRADRKASGRCR